MENLSKEKQLYLSVADKINGVLDDENAKEIFDALKSGQNSYLRLDRVESSSFDNSWIENIEQCLPDLGYIINNPRSVTKTTEDLTPVELAKKTNATSVMHLASHTQYVKDIDENGNVIPNKILSIGSDDDLKTYENRFIATLIRKLVLFVEKRYEFVKSFATLMDHEQLYLKNSSEVNGSQVSIETKIIVDSPKEEKVKIETNDYTRRIEQVREFVLYYYNSRFMKMFKTDKNVKNPILQTNIIRKNQKYHHCYELYRFIEAYDKLGVNYGVKEDYQVFTAEELASLNALTFVNYLSLQGKDKKAQKVTKENEYSPEIITSSDDEEFVYGPLLKGPISFVRTDENYQKYLNSKVRNDLPSDPSTQEKAYYQDEYDKKQMSEEDYNEKIKLLERKENDKLVFDDEVKNRIERYEAELEFLKEKRLKKRHEEEEEYLKKFRIMMIDEARKYQVSDHDFGVYLSNEVYADLRNGIGLSTTIDSIATPVSDETQPVSDFDEKEEIDSALLDVEQLGNGEIITVSEEVNSIADLIDIKIVSTEEDIVPISNVELMVQPIESEEDRKLREAMEDEKNRLLEEMGKNKDNNSSSNNSTDSGEKKVVVINNFVPTSITSNTGTVFNGDDSPYTFVETGKNDNSNLLNSLTTPLVNKDSKDNNSSNRNHLGSTNNGGGVITESIKNDKRYQFSDNSNRRINANVGYLSELLKKSKNFKGLDETKYSTYYKNLNTDTYETDDDFEEFGK